MGEARRSRGRRSGRGDDNPEPDLHGLLEAGAEPPPGTPAGYGAPTGYGPPTNYGAPTGYGPPTNYGAPQGYGTPQGHGTGAGTARPAETGPGGELPPVRRRDRRAAEQRSGATAVPAQEPPINATPPTGSQHGDPGAPPPTTAGRQRGVGRRVSPDSQPAEGRALAHRIGLPVLSGLLLSWAATTLVGDVAWGPLSVMPVAFASLSPFLVLAAIPVITMAAWQRRWFTLAPALVAAVLPWAFVLGYMSAAPVPQGAVLPLRAMLVTAHDGRADAQEITTAARRGKIDLLVVTELSAQLTHDLASAGLAQFLPSRYIAVPETSPSALSGLGIYSRFPVEQVAPLAGTHWPAVTATVIVEQTKITLVAGHAVPPGTAHLDRWSTDLAAFGAASRIPGKVLVLANLNATAWHSQFRQITSGRLHDAADVLGRGLRPTWPGVLVPLLPTDHVLVAGGLGVDALETTKIGGSDHQALTAHLRIPAG